MSSKDSGHGDSEQGDSDHEATNRGHSSGRSSCVLGVWEIAADPSAVCVCCRESGEKREKGGEGGSSYKKLKHAVGSF